MLSKEHRKTFAEWIETLEACANPLDDYDRKALTRLLDKVEVNDSQCWVWQAATSMGYGTIWYVDKLWPAPRLAYKLIRGDLPPRGKIFNGCGNRLCINPEHMLTYAERRKQTLLSKVKKTESGCWEWQGAINQWGYGVFQYDGTGHNAHRVAYMLLVEPVPDDLVVCHRCDNRRCINPGHLFLGTHEDNAQDMIAKSRDNYAKGKQAGPSTLSRKEVLEIRRLYRDTDVSYSQLSERFDTSIGNISAIINRQTWSHLPEHDAISETE